MSYTEYLRRKAVAAPVVVDTRLKLDASSYTSRVRLAASSDFSTDGQKYGSITNVSDPDSGGNAGQTIHAVASYKKGSGGRVPDASTHTAFRGSQALAKQALVPKPVRYVLNSNDVGSLSGCLPVPTPMPYVRGGLLVQTATATFSSVTFSTPIVTFNYNPFTFTAIPNTGVLVGSSVTVSGFGSLGITAIDAPIVGTQIITVGGGFVNLIKAGTPVTLANAGTGNNGTFTVLGSPAPTPTTFAITNPGGSAVSTGPFGTVSYANAGTFTITAVDSTSFSVSNTSGGADASPYSTITAAIPIYSSGAYAPNMVPLSASQQVRDIVSCKQLQGEKHTTDATTYPGPPVFVDNTISQVKNYNLPQNNTDYQISQKCSSCGGNPPGTGVTCAFCIGAIHTPPADMPHNTRWAPRPTKSAQPILVAPSPSDARKVGNFNPRRLPFVGAHHGNPKIGHIQYPETPYQIPAGTAAHLKINDPMHYPGTM